MHNKVDINCDLGEGKTLQNCQLDAKLMPYISRCNIACGGHAGNLMTMQSTLENAKKNGILCGAHPGYPDPEHFGRQSLDMDLTDLISSILEQIAQLEKIAESVQQPLSHIKLHGALYNDAEKSPKIAQAICQALVNNHSHLTIIGLANGAMQTAAQSYGMTFLREGFMDRAYLATGHLAPRTLHGAVYQDIPSCIKQIMAMLTQQAVPVLVTEQTENDKNIIEPLYIDVDTYCLHGDTPIAQNLAKQLAETLTLHGYRVA